MLPAGRYVLRAQVAGPAILPRSARIEVNIRETGAEFAKHDATVARLEHPVDPQRPDELDRLDLDFSLRRQTSLRLSCGVSDSVGSFRARALKIQRRRLCGTLDWSTTHAELDKWPLDRLRNVTLANSGVCPASCLHCPTNKSWLDVPNPGVMSENVFEALVDGLVASGLPITGSIGFGLFGDPFTDRQLASRIRRLKEALPGVPVTISTPVAAYGPRQAEEVEAADSIAVHIESVDPDVYDSLMAPLSLAKVKPRIEALVADAGSKAQLAVPVHRRNFDGLPALEDWWRGLGGGSIVHQPFSNRLNPSASIAAMHLSPVAGACTQDLAYDLVVDWDGKILTCCSDFHRRGGLGSLKEAPLQDLLADMRRERLFKLLRNREWNAIGLCRTCTFDDVAATQAAVLAAGVDVRPSD